MQCPIEHIAPEMAKKLCQDITQDLPEYFGLPEVNEQYAEGMLSRVSFAAKVQEQWIGLLTLEFPYPDNANIYWIGVKRDFQGKGIGQALMNTAKNYAVKHGIKSFTVETLSPNESDENYLKTFHFYKTYGFQPLFNLKPQHYEYIMVYMYKPLAYK